MENETIGHKILRLREAHKWSQADLAKRAGYTNRTTIAKIEAGLITPSVSKIKALATALGVEPASIMDDQEPQGVRIPVLGTVVAGIPIDAITEVDDWEEIPKALAATGDFFALHVKGHSMEPNIPEGDILIVKKQEDVDSGDIAIVFVNGNEATCKQVKKSPAGITLQGFNFSVYQPHFYSNKEIEELPVRICGRVVRSIHQW